VAFCNETSNAETPDCLTSCPPGFFAANGWCHECSDNCLECVSADNCTTCEPGFRQTNDGGCLGSCPNDDEFINEDGECESCTAPCATCAITSTNCTSCLDGYELDEESDSCVIVGGSPCGPGCLDCANNTYCNECDTDFYLVISADQEEATCEDSCPNGSSPAQDENICVDCNLENCRRCFVNETCSACDSGYALQNGECT
jgi:hypothetical protein